MKRHVASSDDDDEEHHRRRPPPPGPDSAAVPQYLVELEDTTRHTFELIDEGNTYGPNFERPHVEKRADYGEQQRELDDYYARQAPIILELLARTNKTQESVVHTMLSKVYASSLEELHTTYGLNARPDFGELLLYYIHHNNTAAIKSLVAGAYDEYGSLKLDDPSSLYRKPAVRGVFKGRRLHLLFRVAGRHANITTFRLLQQLARDVTHVAGLEIYTDPVVETFVGALEMARMDLVDQLLKFWQRQSVLRSHPYYRSSCEAAAFRGLARDPTILEHTLRVHFLPGKICDSPTRYYMRIPVEALTPYVLSPNAKDPNEAIALFTVWAEHPAFLREKQAVLEQNKEAWVEAARTVAQYLHTISRVSKLLTGVPLDPVCLPFLLSFMDLLFVQKDVCQRLARDVWIRWAIHSGCLHALANHRFVFTWDEVKALTEIPQPWPYKYRSDPPHCSWDGMILEARYYEQQGTEALRWFGEGFSRLISLNGMTKAPTLAQFQQFSAIVSLSETILPLSTSALLGICRLFGPDTSRELVLAVFYAIRTFPLDVDSIVNSGVYGVDDVLSAWSHLMDAVQVGVIPSDEFTEYIRACASGELMLQIFDHGILVQRFTYQYSRSLLMLLISLDYEEMLGNGGEASFDDDEEMLAAWVEDAEQQVDRNYGPRERTALLFFHALLLKHHRQQLARATMAVV